jgi:hypothetical protein
MSTWSQVAFGGRNQVTQTHFDKFGAQLSCEDTDDKSFAVGIDFLTPPIHRKSAIKRSLRSSIGSLFKRGRCFII